MSRSGSDDEVNLQGEKWKLRGSILVIRESAVQCIMVPCIDFDGSVVVQLEEA
jgi:hypothetical protein